MPRNAKAEARKARVATLRALGISPEDIAHVLDVRLSLVLSDLQRTTSNVVHIADPMTREASAYVAVVCGDLPLAQCYIDSLLNLLDSRTNPLRGPLLRQSVQRMRAERDDALATVQTSELRSGHQELNENLFKRCDELDVSVRTAERLQQNEFEFIWQLCGQRENTLYALGFGRKVINELKEVLADLGLSLGMHIPNLDT